MRGRRPEEKFNKIEVEIEVMSSEIIDHLESKKKAIEEFVKILRDRYSDRVKKVILFGSVARGDSSEESDIDVLVVGSMTLDEIINVTFPILLRFGEFISPHVMDEEHYMRLKSERSGFIESVEKEGKNHCLMLKNTWGDHMTP